MSEPALKIERIGHVARLTLNRPQEGNTISLEMAEALLEAASECDRDPSIRCVLLTAEGKLFCGGGNIGSFAEAGDKIPAVLSRLTGIFHAAVARFARMDKPMVTAVNGGAAGAGLGLSILADIVLAGSKAHFTYGYSAIGFTPDGGTSWLLPRLIGTRKAVEMALTNRRVLADEAAELGLVTRVVDQDALQEEALALATQLAAGATRSLGTTRNLMLNAFDQSLETHMEMESRAIASASVNDEGKEGVSAFLEKRAPRFI